MERTCPQELWRAACSVCAALAVAACDGGGAGAAGKGSPAATTTASAAASAELAPVAPVAPVASAAPPTRVAAQHVLIAYRGAQGTARTTTRSKADARKRAAEVLAKAKSGADFSALVAEYSDDLATKERMGSLGTFTRDKMVGPFSDAAFALAVGGVSEPVETPFGFHVIKRNQ